MIISRRGFIAAAGVAASSKAFAQCSTGYQNLTNVFACQQAPLGSNFGSSTIPTGAAQAYSGGQWGTAFLAPQSGTLQSLSVYMTSAGGTVQIALYSLNGVGGKPGSLLVASTVFAPVGGWNTIQIAAGPAITSGTTYFFSYLGVSGTPTIQWVDQGASGRSWYSNNFGSISPSTDPFPAPLADTNTWPLYGTIV